MATGGRRAYDWRPWARPAPGQAGEDGAPSPVAPGPVRGRAIRSAAMTGLFGLGCVYTLSVARDFLLPLAIGLVLYFLLRPPVRALKAARVPEPLGAALVLLALVSVMGAALYALSWPAASWISRGPEGLHRIESKLRPVAVRLQRLTRTAEEMQRIADTTPSTTPQVQIKEPGFGSLVVGGMQSLLAGTVVVLTLAYFLLAEGDELMRKIVLALPRLNDRKRAVLIAHEMETQISGYLFFSAVMNAAFGGLIAGVMWLLGMPNPVLWGFVAGVTKFIPYLGGVVCAVVLAMASILTFDDIAWALLVPGVFLAIDTVHGSILMPLLFGRRFTLDSALLFVGLFFWWYVWGTAGALLAVPMMSALRIFCDHVEGLQRFGRILGGAEEPTSGPAPDALAARPPTS